MLVGGWFHDFKKIRGDDGLLYSSRRTYDADPFLHSRRMVTQERSLAPNIQCGYDHWKMTPAVDVCSIVLDEAKV